jgi:hypothetical protein
MPFTAHPRALFWSKTNYGVDSGNRIHRGMGQMEQATKTALEATNLDVQHSSPSLSPQDNELVARADEQLAHAYEQIASADEQLTRLNQTLFRYEQQDVRPELRFGRDRPARRGMIGLLLAACIFVAAFVAQSSYGDAARLIILQWYPQLGSVPLIAEDKPELAQTIPSGVQDVGSDAAVQQAAVAAPTLHDTLAPAATISPEQSQMLQSLSQSTEQLKTSQEQNARELARVSEQLKVAQAQMARDNASAAEQFRLLQMQVARLTAAASEQNVGRPQASAPPKPITLPRPKPLPALASPQARAQPLVPTDLRPAQQ